MNAIDVLKAMHEEAKGAFGKIEHASQGERLTLWGKLQPELVTHELIEEELVYHPVTMEVGTRDEVLGGWEMRHQQQVQEAEGKIHTLNGGTGDDRWLQMLVDLRTTLEHHMQTEENDIWPRIRDLWGQEKLDRVGTEIDSMWAQRTGKHIGRAA